MTHAAEEHAIVIYLGTFIPCFNILQLSYRSQYQARILIYSHIFILLYLRQKKGFVSLGYREVSAFLLLGLLTEIIASSSGRGQTVFSTRNFEIVFPGFELPF